MWSSKSFRIMQTMWLICQGCPTGNVNLCRVWSREPNKLRFIRCSFASSDRSCGSTGSLLILYYWYLCIRTERTMTATTCRILSQGGYLFVGGWRWKDSLSRSTCKQYPFPWALLIDSRSSGTVFFLTLATCNIEIRCLLSGLVFFG